MMPGLGGDPRQMAMMMRKLGIQVTDLKDVQEVVIRTAEADYVFNRASVSVMKAQGTETWQVSGNARKVPKGAASAPTSAPMSASPLQSASKPAAGAPTPAASAAPLAIPDDDVQLVAESAGVTLAVARKALESTQGDIAEAILQLGS